MSFTQAINDRHSLMSPDIAQTTGQSLFTWFKEPGALDADHSPFAVRAIAMGTNALQTGKSMAVEDIVDMIRSTYEHSTEGLS